VHGTASAAQGAPGSNSCRKVNQVNASSIVKGLLFGFEGPSSLRFFDTLDAETGFQTTTSPALRSQPLWAYSSAG
jgi:hypothetical protein